MSMIRCEECDEIFDSDEDPECFVEVGNMRRLHQTKVICEYCRDDMDYDYDYRQDRSNEEEGLVEE